MKTLEKNPCDNGCKCKHDCKLYKDDPRHGEMLLRIFKHKLKQERKEHDRPRPA